MNRLLLLAATMTALCASPILAQDSDENMYEDTVYDGDYLLVAVGGLYGPDYVGSDDSEFIPGGAVLGRYKGVEIHPRIAGFALDFIPDPDIGLGYNAGLAFKVRTNRTSSVDNDQVNALDELDVAVEVGPALGVSIAGVLDPYDSLTFNTDIRWDVASGHKGMTVSPSISYLTPVSYSTFVAMSLSLEYGDDDYNDYYFSVSPEGSAASGLEEFDADSGFHEAGITLGAGYDLDGNLTNGGLMLAGVVSYNKLLDDADDSPIVSDVGDSDQFYFGLGIGYVF